MRERTAPAQPESALAEAIDEFLLVLARERRASRHTVAARVDPQLGLTGRGDGSSGEVIHLGVGDAGRGGVGGDEAVDMEEAERKKGTENK